MKKSFRGKTLLLIICLIIAFAGSACTVKGIPPSLLQESREETKSTQEAFHSEFVEYTNSLIKDLYEGDTLDTNFVMVHPEKYGMDHSHGTWKTFNKAEGEESDEAYCKRKLKELRSFNQKDLNREEKITYDVLEDRLKQELSVEKLGAFYEPLNGMSGYQTMLPVYLIEFTFYTEQDVKNYLELLDTIEAHFEDLLLYEQKKAKSGLFMEEDQLKVVLKQIKAFLETEETDFLGEGFKERIKGLHLSKKKVQSYQKSLKKRIPNVYKAYRSLYKGMKALKGANQYQGGLCHYPEGKAYYDYILKSEVGTDKDGEELIELLDQEIQTGIGKMSAYSLLNTDIFDEMEQVQYSSEDPEEILEILKEKTKDEFPKIGDLKYQIKYVNPNLQAYLNPAFYFDPPIDDQKTNVIYINPTGNWKEELWPTLAHEGIPGHMYQLNYGRRKGQLPVRQVFGTTGYIEGWAEMAESRSYRYLDEPSDFAKELLRVNAETTIYIYARSELGVHYEGWSLKKYTRFFKKYFGEDLNQNALKRSYDYTVSNPGGYTDYGVGLLEYIALENRGMEELDLSQEEFFERYLTIGAAPFKIVRKYLFENEGKKK